MHRETDQSLTSLRYLLAEKLGIAVTQISETVAAKAAREPLYLHHLITCRSDAFLRDLLLREALTHRLPENDNRQASSELLRKAAGALTSWLAAGAQFVDEESFSNRLAACNACEHKIPAPKVALYRLIQTRHICDICGCDVTKKAKLRSERCPDTAAGATGRWP
jgi:hypothetical protein